MIIFKTYFIALAIVLLQFGCGEPQDTSYQGTSDNDIRFHKRKKNGLPENLSGYYLYASSSNRSLEFSRCIETKTLEEAVYCLENNVPLLRQDEINNPISIEDVKKRIIVDNDWMAENFIRIFLNFPEPVKNDLLHMFGYTSAIVLGSNIRPSFQTHSSIFEGFNYEIFPTKSSKSEKLLLT